ncbi:MAG: 2-hydroxycarboxylate transporter family protein [Opitutaceae bacterium]|nr:2-hydroxycarboxylate transporter family protein [Opitutaceae bacterium]
MSIKVGPLPLPLYLILLAVILTASVLGKLPADMIGGFAVIIVMGWLLGEVGIKTPILRNIGGPAILSLFVPSILVFYKLLNPNALNAITAVMKTANFLYLYIACLVCGSILGMNRKMLIQGFMRLFIPLLVGEIVTISVAISVAALLGFDVKNAFFFIIVPIIGGGIGEGALPYSMALSDILGQPQATFIPKLIPAAMIGNLFAIICSGGMKFFGDKYPKYSGNGLLVKTGDDAALLAEANKEKPIEFPLMGAGLLIACTFFIFGLVLSPFIGIPGPIIMIFFAAIVKYFNVLPENMQKGAYHLYRFVASNLTWPLLVGLGVLYTSWADVLRAFSPGYIAICLSVVLSMWTTGFFVGKFLNMYPVETAIVTGCHTGLGGTGDVAILSASNRIGLMPFAQAATRLGGAWMIVLATILLKIFQ